MKFYTTVLVVMIVILFSCLVAFGYETENWHGFDEVYMGVAWKSGTNTETCGGFNLATYKGNAVNGALALMEPSVNFNVLSYQHIQWALDEIGKSIKPMVSLSINGIETAKLIPPFQKFMDLIPGWVLIGAGVTAEYDSESESSEIRFNGRLTAAVKVILE